MGCPNTTDAHLPNVKKFIPCFRRFFALRRRCPVSVRGCKDALHILANRLLPFSNRTSRHFIVSFADIFVVSTEDGKELILKLHRLGRTSFTNVTNKRDYTRKQGKRNGASWLQLSRLAALKVMLVPRCIRMCVY